MHLPTEETIRAALDMAQEAPLAGATLPWKWWLNGAALHIRLDDSRIAVSIDPAIRRTQMIGHGAALHHLATALPAFGWAVADTVPLPDPIDPNYLAVLHLTPATATRDQIELAGAIFQRQFQHNRFRPWEMPSNLIRSISRGAAGTRAAARHVPDGLRSDLAAAYRRAADRNTDFGEFLTGVAGRVDQREPVLEPETPTWASERIEREAPEDPFADRSPDAAELLVLCTPIDDPASHLSAGAAASSIVLTAAGHGLASSLLTQTMTVPDVRSGVRDNVLYECAYPHALIRLGRPDQSDTGRRYVRALPGATTVS
ncbi:hypothetical protein ACFVMC_14030 [Nocardia sp. NPDC127579]|uniref:hypothetical protein n=1 Tax=Nocardia sp. NPDC127579 TaxID=3345402 RepID=UPI003638AA29